jgi:hypothetical protein
MNVVVELRQKGTFVCSGVCELVGVCVCVRACWCPPPHTHTTASLFTLLAYHRTPAQALGDELRAKFAATKAQVRQMSWLMLRVRIDG